MPVQLGHDCFDVRRRAFVFAALAVFFLIWTASGPSDAAQAGGQPSASSGAAEAFIGGAIYSADWIAAPNVSDGADGLGPLFNATSCAACHPGQDASLGALGRPAVQAVPHVLRLARRSSGVRRQQSVGLDLPPVTPDPDPRYGAQLQDRAIPGHAAEGQIAVRWAYVKWRLGDGTEVNLRLPRVRVSSPVYGPLSPDVAMSLRRPPPLEGLSVVAAIDESRILSNADPEDRDGDGISGRPGYALDERRGKQVLARFGWKASVASLADQTAAAFSLDMGLSSVRRGLGSGDCTPLQAACRSAVDGASAAKGGFEVSEREIDLVVVYLESLPAPMPSGDTKVAESRGATQFAQLGCAACHRIDLSGTTQGGVRSEVSRDVRLFSDLLLHDMGLGLGDGIAEGTASGREWRTPPLWGLSLRLEDIARGRIQGLLHDGRARTIEEAVLWHGGEGAASRERFWQLAAPDRANFLAYLSGL
ncbi:MAG: c-type cytochrome [Hyphomicrobiaceae bacterium]|nr:c-type cytochrome [Hyphomicrobiaceae bacterium]